MKEYDLREFAFLLGLTLWPGGKVSDLGYFSKAGLLPQSSKFNGILALALSNNVFLEKYEPKNENEFRLILSVYNHYSGQKQFYELYVDADKNNFEKNLFSIIENGKIAKKSSVTPRFANKNKR